MFLNQLELIKDLFQLLYFLINNKKSQLEPSQEILFLGLAILITAMQVSLWLKQLHSKAEVSVQKLVAFAGMTTVVKQAIQVAPLFHHHL